MTWDPARQDRRWLVAIGSSLVAVLLGAGVCAWSVFSDVPWSGWASMAGLSVIGLGVVATAAGVRRLLVSLLPLRAIDNALAAYATGERRDEALGIDESWGDRAKSWSGILAERQQAGDQALEAMIDGIGERNSGGSADLRAAFQALPIGVLVLDQQTRLLEVNGAARLLLGLEDPVDGSSAVGLAMAMVGVDDQIVTAVGEVSSGARRQAMVRLSRGEGRERTAVHVRVRAMREESQAGAFLVTCEDVTQREIKDESHGIFLSHATHELRTPLTNIKLYAEEAVEMGDEDPELRTRALDVILSETRRLERTVTDMLSASEIESGTLSLRVGVVRLEPVFEDLEHDFRALADSKGITLGFELPPKYPVAQADREKLTLAIHNIVGNAIKYTPEGGNVTVGVTATETDLVVRVQDTGIGIAPEHQGRVFDRFYRAGDERVKDVTGTGLGLCLSREIARLHGGEVTLESALNEGSTFTLIVPIAERRRVAA